MRTCSSLGSSSETLLDLRELRGVLADDPDRLGVREEIADVTCGVVGVDRDPDGADLRQREIDERPVEAVLGEDSERVALAHAAGEEPVRVGAHELVRIAPGHLAPAAALRVLDEVGRCLPLGGYGVSPEARDRAAPAGRTRLAE